MVKQKQQKQDFGKMRTREMIGYGFTDMAGNLLFVTFSSFIMIFYTDVMGLPASGGWSAAIVLLVARIVNAILSIVWGSVIDHTKTRWGQCRPWFLFLAGPFCVTTFLCFCNFGGSTIAKFWYAMLLYILSSGFVYTGLSAAMSAVLPNLTNKNEERIKANSWRMVGGALGSFITTVATPLITGALISGAFAKFGDAKAKNYAYMVVIAMWAVMAAAMLVSAFAWMRERNYNPNYKPLAFKTSCKALKGNWPWFILVSAFIMMWVLQSTKNGTAVYYAKWILCNDTWVPSVINGIQVIGVITAIITPFAVKAYSKKFKAPKTSVLFTALGIAIIGQIGMALFDPAISKFISPHSVTHISSFLAWWVVGTFGVQWTMGMFFMMIADTVDYGEWKTGIKAPGLLASVGASFSIQLGGAFGQYVPMQIMGAKGYDGTITMDPTKTYGGQSDSAAWAIKFSFFWLPLIFMIVLGAIMIAYIHFEKNEGKIRAVLEERHSKTVQSKPGYVAREIIKDSKQDEKKQAKLAMIEAKKAKKQAKQEAKKAKKQAKLQAKKEAEKAKQEAKKAKLQAKKEAERAKQKAKLEAAREAEKVRKEEEKAKLQAAREAEKVRKEEEKAKLQAKKEAEKAKLAKLEAKEKAKKAKQEAKLAKIEAKKKAKQAKKQAKLDAKKAKIKAKQEAKKAKAAKKVKVVIVKEPLKPIKLSTAGVAILVGLTIFAALLGVILGIAFSF